MSSTAQHRPVRLVYLIQMKTVSDQPVQRNLRCLCQPEYFFSLAVCLSGKLRPHTFCQISGISAVSGESPCNTVSARKLHTLQNKIRKFTAKTCSRLLHHSLHAIFAGKKNLMSGSHHFSESKAAFIFIYCNDIRKTGTFQCRNRKRMIPTTEAIASPSI